MEIIAKAYLWYRDRHSDKVYYAILEKHKMNNEDLYMVRGRWGRRTGPSLQEQVKHHGESYEQAERVFTRLYHSKMAKGYKLISLESV